MFRSVFTCLFLCFFVSLHGAEEKSKDYKLQKDDILKMTVYQEDDLAVETQIGKSGFVSFPLIGNVKLEGLTVKEAEKELKARYEKDYLVTAQVNLTVLSYAKKWVVVGGDVRSGGKIEFAEKGSLDLRGAIAQAGGLLESANADRIVLRRKSGSVSTVSLSGSGGLILRHGDTISVMRNAQNQSTVTVSGQVNRPGVVPFPKEGGLNIVTAIAQAGGFSRIANRKSVNVSRNGRLMILNYRDMANGKIEMFRLRPGDLIIVKESRF